MAELNALGTLLRLSRMGVMKDEDLRMFYNINSIRSRYELWMNNGGKTFILTKELVEAFQHTDIPYACAPSFFKYPFPAFVIESLDVPLFHTVTPSGTAGVYALMYTGADAVYADKNCHILTVTGEKRETLDWSRSLYGFFPSSGGQALDAIMLNMSDDISIGRAASMENPIAKERLDPDDARNMINIFFNTIMYINDPGRVVAETESRGTRKFKMGGNKRCSNEYIALKPPRSYIPLNKGGEGGRTIDKRFIVRGHWRNQAYGAGRAERRSQWIKPFWKGPELAEIVSRPYLVKGD
jgi:hypothetical protein